MVTVETSERQSPDRRLRVLSVEDDVLVGMGTTGMLEDLGCEVTEALSGEQALALLDAGLEIDLLITDQGMAGMSGIQLADAVRKRRVGLPSVLVTGYLQLPTQPGEELVVLRKPFRESELAAAIQKALPAGRTMSDTASPPSERLI